MSADEELLTSSLAMLRSELDDADADRRTAEFRGVLHQLRDDPAELARIDALVMDAERGQLDATATGGGTIYVNGGVVHIHHGQRYSDVAIEERVNANLTRMGQEFQRLAALLEEKSEQPRPRPRPRRVWETLLRPAFGGGILVAVLAAATVTVAVHASAAAVSIIGITLAMTTAVIALLSVLVPWTSVHALNRRGDAHIALELLRKSSLEQEGADVTWTERNDVLTHSEGLTSRGEAPRSPAWEASAAAAGPPFPGSGSPAITRAWEASAAAPVRFSPEAEAPRSYSSEHGGHRGVGTSPPTECVSCGSSLDPEDVFCGVCGRATGSRIG